MLREQGDIEEILQRCYLDDRAFARVFFPDRFSRPFDPLHEDILEVVNADKQQKALAAPRGFGKTSIASFLKPAKKILFCEKHYIVIISATASSAMEQTENLKTLISRNPLVEQLFGDIKTKEWSKERWVVEIPGETQHDSHEVCVMPRGSGQQIRGKLFRNSRPDYICGDDIEDPKKVQSADQREQVSDWWYSDVMGSVDKPSPTWEIVFIGTVLHEDALLVNLLESENWFSERIELCDDEFNSFAPNWITDEECKRSYERFAEDGKSGEWMREYRNLPVPPEDKEFQPEMFQYYNDEITEQELNSSPLVDSFVIIDPARTGTRERGSETAIVGVSVNTSESSIFYRRIEHGHFGVGETINNAIVMAQSLNAQAIAMEDTGLKEYATHPLKNELSRRNLPFQVITVKARGGNRPDSKEARIGQLVSYYQNNLVYHNRKECDPLEQQLLAYPRPKRWDIMDAAAYVPQVLEENEQYMMPPDMDAFHETEAEVEEEFEELNTGEYYEEPLEKDWRMI
ncbi:MAG: hypothetical protein ABEJ72_05775 [Candidatus Aenigmatarchaeota archaeon]